jgi:hypothetical protein
METIDFVLGLSKEIKDSFLKVTSELSKAYGLCATTFEAEKHNVEISFYKTVRAGVLKFEKPVGWDIRIKPMIFTASAWQDPCR